MKHSSERILTTHVGSLVRPPEVLKHIIARVKHEPVDEEAFARDVREGVKEAVRKQAEAGIDVPSDGEFSKPSFSGYVTARLKGVETRRVETTGAQAMNYPILNEEFPGFMTQYNGMYRTMWMPPEIPRDGLTNLPREQTVVTGPVSYTGQAAVQQDIANFKSAMEGLKFEEAFIPAATPSVWETARSEYYSNEQQFLYAMADALHEEYKAIVDAGFLVQLDLGLPARNQVLPGNPHPSWEELRRVSEMQIDAYNHALQGIPEDRVRYHLCWGSMNTPHTSDIPLKDIVDLILRINAQAYSIEAANPRHEHEWMVWKDVKLPEGKILIPGIVSHQTNVVEHPELVAWRIENYASVLGKENVIAGTDCGFSQGWNMIRVHPEVQWAKLKALADGAALASKKLWGKVAV
ncbi:MAG TPA: cobalamin-independent methionine synthase II family protein [Dehalococcoidia bacterium]|nr:cobalamin-independent methionine synthase II family protein [Dehalococcoidia bacterium]